MTPAQKLKQYGASALTDSELLSLLLTDSDSKALITHFGTLSGIFSASYETLTSNMKEYEIIRTLATTELCERLAEQSLTLSPKLDNHKVLEKFFISKLGKLQTEQICCVFLDNQLRVIEHARYPSNHANQVHFPLREIIKTALNTRTQALAIAHNHPAGTAHPSNADITATHQLQILLQNIDITLLDHMIIASNQCFSFKQERLLVI